MNSPLLSICIPTYNRAEYLRECLDSIVCQFKDEEVYRNVEVIISDNLSDDGTVELINEYKLEFNNIFLNINPSNMGGPKNIINSLDLARGDYLWLLGDDDVVRVDSLKYLIKKIINKSYSVVLLNFSLGEHENPNIKIKTNALRIHKNKEYIEFINFFEGKNSINFFGINFLSALIYNKELYTLNRNKFTKFTETLFPQTYAFMILAKNGNILRIARPLVTWRSSVSRRYDDQVTDESRVISDYADFIRFSKTLGYIFDEKEALSNVIFNKITLKNKIFILLKKYKLVSFAKVFYRIPRIIKYYISRVF